MPRRRQLKYSQPTESPSPPLLYSRRQAQHLLGDVSIATLLRLERMRRLRPIKLNKTSPTAATYYSRANLLELVADSTEW
jgi:hypothetical protein